jgi:hypothetical protein
VYLGATILLTSRIGHPHESCVLLHSLHAVSANTLAVTTNFSTSPFSIMGSVQPASKNVLGVGIVGCGEVCQTIHIPTLGHLSEYFQVNYLCDVSDDALQYCKSKVAGSTPKTTRDVSILCASPDVDVVLIANSNEYHAAHAIIALKYNKHVLLEKPASINLRDADAIIAAETDSQGKVFVGYMRRYAAAFVDAIKEIGGVDKILYARVRGKNPSIRHTVKVLTTQTLSDPIRFLWTSLEPSQRSSLTLDPKTPKI